VPVSQVVVAVVVGAAVWLLLPTPPPPAEPPLGGVGVEVDRGERRFAAVRLVPVAVLAVAVGGLVALVDGTTLALGLIVLAVVVGIWRTLARGRLRRAAQERAESVAEVCEALAAELRAGQPPLRALRHCAGIWPALEPVAGAGELGGDVPRALRRLARQPGASGLEDVAAEWQVSEGVGGTMALALGRVVESARRRRTTQRLVASELASAQATARLLAVLPIAVLVMGSGIGADPWAFLLSTPAGLTCLGAGLALTYGGLAWIERIAVTAVDR
jgi:tight adherence protein B